MIRTVAISASEEAYRSVKESILNGDIPGGELLSEGEISARMGCSRTPVREAFLRLETEGWLRLYPKRGALVVPITPEERRHVVDARRVIEGAAAARIAERGAPQSLLSDLSALIEVQLGRAAQGDAAGFAAADVDFHRAIVAKLGNPLLENFYDSLSLDPPVSCRCEVDFDCVRWARGVP
ncbi:GntR family transcriptional regulator [Mycobacteroides abscessus subsp. abscessus]|nr:GntR family transcriptional regulator [Mycobacteroides abscessus subsp. abscessus]SID55615.1 GntR family transcriptional regulator [Mycobacteroides abscessus subsp. abscessus]SIG25699.1 GntR family transcriptional regulator [Mycobacteroides abscessus subsp. abscessus]SIG74756.1 GntR family transcriptional regulator [Mycobacteroides abscessus subsp. abscessus]SIH52488.1 GntR family transcriptional regulator [Mycobacteroides abscessus subsp. abscessus]